MNKSILLRLHYKAKESVIAIRDNYTSIHDELLFMKRFQTFLESFQGDFMYDGLVLYNRRETF